LIFDFEYFIPFTIFHNLSILFYNTDPGGTGKLKSRKIVSLLRLRRLRKPFSDSQNHQNV
jgi:hypothetical protein